MIKYPNYAVKRTFEWNGKKVSYVKIYRKYYYALKRAELEAKHFKRDGRKFYWLVEVYEGQTVINSFNGDYNESNS